MNTVTARFRARCRTAVSLVLLAALAAFLQAGPAAASAGAPPDQSPASMEAIHASYLDLAGNITDLRSRVSEWQKGDESSLNIAGEKLDRIQMVLASVAWPPALAPAITKTKAAADPMSKALKAKDIKAADPAAKAFGDASHDLTHAFYGDWLPALQGTTFTDMAAHASYLDLTANIADLRTRVGLWQQGDESSLNIAKEKVDRLNILVKHMSTLGVLAKPRQAVANGLPAVTAALEKQDAAAAQSALKPIADASHDLTHDFYSWMKITAGPHDPDCVQASYRDLALNVTDLRARITEWQSGGEESSLNIAQEKLERVAVVLDHVVWPSAMAAGISVTRSAVEPLKLAFKDKVASSAQQALKPIADASHDLTHAYYGDWLPTAHSGDHMQKKDDGMGGMAMPAAARALPVPVSAPQNESVPHGHGAEAQASPVATRSLALGGFGAVNGLVIVVAAVLKTRTTSKAKTRRDNQPDATTGGVSQ